MTEYESLPGLIAHRSAIDPDAVYLVNAEDGSTYTYGQADADARAWARRLAGLGVTPGDTVLTMLPPGEASLASWLGVAWLAAYEVPMNTQYVGRMLTNAMADSGARTMVVHAEYLDAVAQALDETVVVENLVVLGGEPRAVGELVVIGEAELAEREVDVELAPPRPNDIASIMYTSGTTGQSKGVMVPWRQTMLTATGILPPELFSQEDVFYSPFPSNHMSGKGPLCSVAILGARLVFRSRFNTNQFWSDVRAHGVTTTILVGGMSAFLINQPPSPDDREHPLRDVLGVPLPDDVDAFARRFGVRFRTTFNMTETACCIISRGYDLANDTSCGRAREGFEARVVDEFDNEVAPGELGQLILRGDAPWSLMAGYWRRPDATAEAWRNGWFHTGDGFSQDADGNFYFVDRLKDAIRRRGENISSFEVEAEVNDHPAVVESAALAVPSEYGEDEIKVVVVARADSGLTAPDLIAFLESRVPAFMVPRYIEFADELPKTVTNRVRKAELRALGITANTYDRGDSRGRRR